MEWIRIILEVIGLITIIVILVEEISTKLYGLTTFRFVMSRDVRERVRNIKSSSGDKFIDVLRRALAVYDFLWQAKKREASIWIRETDKSESEMCIF